MSHPPREKSTYINLLSPDTYRDYQPKTVAKQRTDDLLQLICTLTQGEKRQFRLFAKRNSSSDDLLFLQLFDVLDKKGEYDEAAILKKIPSLKKEQLPNLKAHLYGQLLTSLRLLARGRNEDILLRENIDYAHVLYDKGLYRQALDILGKTKERALVGQFKSLALEMLEFEKLIEGQYITRSIEGRAQELSEQTLNISRALSQTHEFSNLALQMYGLYLKIGFVRNERDYFFVKEFFNARLPKAKFEELDFTGKIYFCQSHVWLHHICQEFAVCYRFAQRWVDIFSENPTMKALHPVFYLKGLHNLLSALFNSLHDERFEVVLRQLEGFPVEVDFSQKRNVEGLYHLYRNIHQINAFYLSGDYAEGVKIIPGLSELLDTNPFNWDANRILVFQYRIACLYFGDGDYSHAIDFLNKIINQKTIDYRADIQCFARILNLIAHFDLGNAGLVDYQVKSVYRYLLHVEDLQRVQQEVFHFLRKMPATRPTDLPQAFRQLHDRLVPLQADNFERRPFLYLDIISWLESKLENRPIKEIIREKSLHRKKLRN